MGLVGLIGEGAFVFWSCIHLHKLFISSIDLGIDPMFFPYAGRILGEIHYPFHFKDHLSSETFGFDIKLPAGYMRDIYEDTDDWQSIVVRGVNKNDKLHRAESAAEPWVRWMEEYSFYHHRELNAAEGSLS